MGEGKRKAGAGSMAWRPLRRTLLALVVPALALPAQDAAALWDDRLELFAAERLTHDDNVFRDRARLSDSWSTTSVGFNLDVPVSRQRFLAGAAVHENRYSNYKVLNYTGKEARGAWVWELGDRLSGRLGLTHTEAQGNFANFAGLRTPNLLKTDQQFLEARYMLTPRWRLQGGLTETRQRNSDAARMVNDIDAEATEAAVSYVTPAGNSLGISARNEDGRLPNRQVVAGSFIDNAYNQKGTGLVGEWLVTAQSRLNGRIDRVRRHYEQVPQRNFDGTTYRAVYDWTPGGRISVNAVAQRDISASEDLRTSLVLVRGVTVRPRYEFSERTSISGFVDISTRDYLADPGTILGVTGGRTDKVRLIGATVAWQPRRLLQVLATLQHESRSSSFAPATFTSNLLSLSARIAF